MLNLVKKSVYLAALPATVLLWGSDAIAVSFNLGEATVDSLQAGFASGAVTCTEITQLYLNRIDAFDDQGPKLNAIIATNPNALSIAADLDAQYAAGGPVGSLHCVPVVLKDNYDTVDM
ncbi:MAG: amidase, partial [Cyanobacteria bacterium Co-bin13]|nr:amidase [Cyanobacteria bacterium Co-bin13]